MKSGCDYGRKQTTIMDKGSPGEGLEVWGFSIIQQALSLSNNLQTLSGSWFNESASDGIGNECLSDLRCETE